MPALIQVPEISLRIMSLNAQYFAGPIDDELNFMGRNPIPKKELDYHKEQTAKLIAEINPDVVCLQEIDKCSARTHFEDQTEDLVRKIARISGKKPYNHKFGSCIDLNQKKLEEELAKLTEKIKIGRFKFGEKLIGQQLKEIVPWIRKIYEDEKFEWYFNKLKIETKRLPPGKIKLHFGNATLVRPGLPIKDVKHEYFLSPKAIIPMYVSIMRRKDERKSFLRCNIDYFPDVPEKIPLYVINTHFECKEGKIRQKQAKILYDKLHERSGAHKILAGDFNDDGDGSLDMLLKHPNIDRFKEFNQRRKERATYPTWQESPEYLFDAILASKFLKIENYYVHPAKVSDHYAVITDIKINQDLVPKNILKQMLAKRELRKL